MKILVDADVLLDVALARAPHVESSAALLEWLEARPGVGIVAWHTVANLYYLMRGPRADDEVRRFIAELLGFLDVAGGTNEDVEYALDLPLKDFEDALQVAAARNAGATMIATRNGRDYAKAPIVAKHPNQLLRGLQNR